jgi:hypothetical protein
MKFLNFFLLLWVTFALLDPDPDPLTRLNPDPFVYHLVETLGGAYIQGGSVTVYATVHCFPFLVTLCYIRHLHRRECQWDTC